MVLVQKRQTFTNWTGSWTKSFRRRGGRAVPSQGGVSDLIFSKSTAVKYVDVELTSFPMSQKPEPYWLALRRLDKELRAARGEECPLAGGVADLRRFMLLKSERVCLLPAKP